MVITEPVRRGRSVPVVQISFSNPPGSPFNPLKDFIDSFNDEVGSMKLDSIEIMLKHQFGEFMLIRDVDYPDYEEQLQSAKPQVLVVPDNKKSKEYEDARSVIQLLVNERNHRT